MSQFVQNRLEGGQASEYQKFSTNEHRKRLSFSEHSSLVNPKITKIVKMINR